MAILHLDIRSRSRSAGTNAVRAAAYIAREKLRDQQRNKTYDYRGRGGLEYSEILTPQGQDGESSVPPPDRATLWNQAELAEHRRDSRVAREYQFSLPNELDLADRIALARSFAQHIADRYGGAVDLAVHQPPPGGDPRNVHAHVLATTRTYGAEGLGRKTDMELSDRDRAAKGLSPIATEFKLIRAHWAGIVNEALRDRGIEERLDPRTLAEQGIDRTPQRHLGPKLIALIRSGKYSYVAERIKLEQEAERARTLEREQAMNRTAPAMTLDERRRQALESWKAFLKEERENEGKDGAERDNPDVAREQARGAEREFER